MNAEGASYVNEGVTFAYRAGLAALAVSVFATSALAEDPPKPEAPRVVSSTDLAYLAGVAGIYRGTELVGVGSRQPYVGALVEGDLLFTGMLSRRVGIDLGMSFGEAGVTSSSGDEYFGRMELAAVTPLLRHDGPRGYSLLAGAGAGVTVGGRWWWADVRVYPYALARFTYLFTRETSMFAEAAVAPIDTSLVAHTWAVENRFEIGGSVGLFFAGARVALSSVDGGDPARTYGDLGVSFYLGIGARFAPARGTR